MKKTIIVISSLLFGMNVFAQTAVYYGQFQSIPANAISPKGWLKQYLINQDLKIGLKG